MRIAPSTIILGLILMAGCSQSVAGDVVDAADQRSAEDHPDVMEPIEFDVPTTDRPNVRDVPNRDVPDLPPAIIEADGGVLCQLAGTEPPPSRSCGDGGAPASHCQQVHYCGGRYRMGHPDAWEIFLSFDPNLRQRHELIHYPDCDLREAVVRSGWVDAYEVSVARIRAWMLAGKPIPPFGTPMSINRTFNIVDTRMLPVPHFYSAVSNEIGHTIADCTYRATPGQNDDLPMNCISQEMAFAFCLWEGKHVLTEEAWEYLGTNRGTTMTPVGAIPSDQELCRIADLGEFPGPGMQTPMFPPLCPHRQAPQSIFATPGDVTQNPPGVYGLLGGLTELVFSASTVMPVPRRPRECNGTLAPNVVEGRPRFGPTETFTAFKGGSWATRLGRARALVYSATRDLHGAETALGFRCARYEMELP